MTVVHLDVESFSDADLKREGLYRYAANPSTDLLVVCYAFDDGPVLTWIPHETGDLPAPLKHAIRATFPTSYRLGATCPDDLADHIRSGGQVRAHNAAFERQVLNGPAGQRLGIPKLSIEQMVCTMAKCAAHGLPHALENAAKALGTHPKDDLGAYAMRYCCKRRADGTRPTPHDEPERFLKLYAYCVDDVLAERAIDQAVPDLSPNEQKVWELDQRMNDRGWKVDMESVGNAQYLVGCLKAELAAECKCITGIGITQTGKLADWCREQGYSKLTDLQVGTVNEALKDDACPPHVKKVLSLFSTHNMKAVTKLDAVVKAAGDDGRLRGMFQYWGANTGRWSSKIVQLQNLYRPVIDDPEIAVEAFRTRNVEWLKALYTPPGSMKTIASTIRSMLVAADGHDLLFLDYAAIEARVNAWLWDEQWKLEAYRAYDAGTGPDLYKLAYAKSFRIPVDEVTKAQRQIGKVMELALGYGGGASAFATMAKTYQLDLVEVAKSAYDVLPPDVREEAEGGWRWAQENGRTAGLDERTYVVCDALKRLWRAAHPGIVAGWNALQESAVEAIRNPGEAFAVPNKRIMFRVDGQWLYMRLPSGRKLAYFRPRVDDDGTIGYMGVDTYTRQWCRTHTYAGKIDENADQAISRDLLASAKMRLERASYLPVGSVHDEPIMEIPEGFGSYDEAARIMCDSPKWAAGLPVAVEGHRAKRYRK